MNLTRPAIRYVVVNAKTGHVINAGIAHEYEDHADAACADLQERYPDMEFGVGQILYSASASVKA